MRAYAAQSAKAALAAALENAEGVREAVAAKDVLEAVQKSSTAAWRAHAVSLTSKPAAAGNAKDTALLWPHSSTLLSEAWIGLRWCMLWHGITMA